MAKALSMKREHSYVLSFEQDEVEKDSSYSPTVWHYRRLTAEESWSLRDDTLSAIQRDGEQHMQFKGGARQSFVLKACLISVENLEDPDTGGFVKYPGSRASDKAKLAFFDRIPADWLSEITDAIQEASEVGEDAEKNSAASPDLSLATETSEAAEKTSA